MTLGRKAAVLGLLGAALYLTAVGRFGIWDPWEIDAADAGRRVSEGALLASTDDQAGSPLLPSLLTGLGFRIGGLSEAAGRMPAALVCLLAPLALFVLLSRVADSRTGALGAVVLLTMPLFAWNVLTMSGDGLAMTGQALVLAGFAEVRLVPPERRRAWAGWVALAIGVVLGLSTRGLLLGAGVPLTACALAAAASGDLALRAGTPRLVTSALLLLSGLAASATGVALGLGEDAWSPWVGGAPRGTFQSFELGIEHVAHATFPWVAVLPFALAWLTRGRADSEDPAQREARQGLAALLLAFVILGFAGHAFHATLCGSVPFGAAAPIACAVALYLAHLDHRSEPAMAVSLGGALAALLVLRDAALFPQTAVAPLALQAEIPEGFAVGRYYAVGAALFLVALHFPLARGSASRPAVRLDLAAPYRFLVHRLRGIGRWARWVAYVVGVAYAWVLVGVLVILTGANVPPWNTMPHVAHQANLVVAALPVAVAACVALYMVLDHGFSRLRANVFLAIPVAGLVVGVVWIHVFLPALSNQFSARETFETFRRLRRSGDLLAEFRVSGRSAAFYGGGRALDLRSVQQAARELDKRERVFVVLERKELAALDQAFRRKAGRHLVVLDDRSRWLLLAANKPVPGERNRNPLERFVRSRPTGPAHRVGAEFEDGKIVYVGYDLSTSTQGWVGAGEEFTITHHFEVVERVAGSYDVFVHIDGHGQRLNGDHVPVDGLYPLRYWSEGDYVLDRQTLRVPVHFRSGDYTIFLGFWRGSTRLEVTAGPNDGDDRVRAGVLRVR